MRLGILLSLLKVALSIYSNASFFLLQEEPKEESDDDMGFSLFD